MRGPAAASGPVAAVNPSDGEGKGNKSLGRLHLSASIIFSLFNNNFDGRDETSVHSCYNNRKGN